MIWCPMPRSPPEEFICAIHDFGRVRIASVERVSEPHIVNTQILRERDERPDWIALMDGLREPTDHIPEAS
jgi:hypothetical protein